MFVTYFYSVPAENVALLKRHLCNGHSHREFLYNQSVNEIDIDKYYHELRNSLLRKNLPIEILDGSRRWGREGEIGINEPSDIVEIVRTISAYKKHQAGGWAVEEKISNLISFYLAASKLGNYVFIILD